MIEQRQKERARKGIENLRRERFFYVSPQELKIFADEMEGQNTAENIHIINGTEDLQKQLEEWEKSFILERMR